MPTTTEIPAAKKSAYQRPYKSRQKRRLDARRKHDEANGASDRMFLVRVAVALGLLFLVALAFAIKGMAESPDAGRPVSAAAPARQAVA